MKIHRFLSLVLFALLLSFTATSVYGQLSMPTYPNEVSGQSQSAVTAATFRAISARIDFNTLSAGGALGFASLNAANGGTMLAQSDCNPCSAICGGAKGKKAAWVNYLGITDTAPAHNYDIDTDGIQVGTDIYRTRDNQFGVTFAYSGTRANWSDDNNPGTPDYPNWTRTNNYNLSFYGSHRFDNQSDLRVIVGNGWLDGRGCESFDPNATYYGLSGSSFDTTLEYGKRFLAAKNVSFRPVLALDYHHYDLYNVSYDEAYFRIGTDYVTMLNYLAIKADIAYNVDIVGEAESTRIYGDGVGRQFTTLGLTTQYDLRKNFALYASYSLDYFFDRNSRPCRGIGTVGFSWVW
ncbi:MAG: autotransporter outer membrane beta-barrel domain-containing protein [Planctomycetaceae bacterium]|jgi:hypothetical protein|nr:autotransporter outer membrane beta-barrel domain-containing protein [Planctomycetaceae bacterium]